MMLAKAYVAGTLTLVGRTAENDVGDVLGSVCVAEIAVMVVAVVVFEEALLLVVRVAVSMFVVVVVVTVGVAAMSMATKNEESN